MLYSTMYVYFICHTVYDVLYPPQHDDLESLPLIHDSSRLDACVAQLREILGPLIEEDQLVRVALAADYDVNRAVNHFFNVGRDEEEEEE